MGPNAPISIDPSLHIQLQQTTVREEFNVDELYRLVQLRPAQLARVDEHLRGYLTFFPPANSHGSPFSA
jgi:hypothetical protein